MGHGHQHPHPKRPQGGPGAEPLRDLDPDRLQPAGNAAAVAEAEAEQDKEFGDEWYHYTLLGAAMWATGAEELVEDGAESLAMHYLNREWWDEYLAGDQRYRQAAVLGAWQDGEIQDHIDALTEEEMVDEHLFRDELGEVLDYIQQFETMKAAGMSFEDMAKVQAAHIDSENRARAEADKTDGSEITDADLQAAAEDNLDDQDYLDDEDTSWWDGLSPQDQASWNSRGQTAITDFVAFAASEYPHLEVKASEIGVDIPGNSNSVAYVDSAGKCFIGRETIVAIERNPAYATSTILHELRGHPEFDSGFSLSMELYEEAAPQTQGYTKPASGSDEEYNEWLRYEYFESEIGALMREESFWVGSPDLDGDGTIAENEENTLGAPVELLDDLLGNLAGQFAPSLQGPFRDRPRSPVRGRPAGHGARVADVRRRLHPDPRGDAMSWPVLLLACSEPAPSAEPPPHAEQPMSRSEAEQHAKNLRFRDNKVVFEESARWLDTHRDEALPAMLAVLADGGPAALGNARVLGKMGDPRAIDGLVAALSHDDDQLAFEAARALARTEGPEAAAALREAAGSDQQTAVRNALRGIAERGDPALCDAVTPHVGGELGFYADKAVEALGCG